MLPASCGAMWHSESNLHTVAAQPMLCIAGACIFVSIAAIQLAAAKIGDKQKNYRNYNYL